MATIQIDSVKLHYEDEGSGTPLLLLHPAASSSAFFADAIANLRDAYRLIAPDLRGLGRSDRVSGPLDPRIWVADIVELMRRLDIGQVVVIGTSLGSRIGGRLAIEHPEIVKALVMDAPMVGLSDRGNAALASQMGATPEADSPAARMFEGWHGSDWRAAVEFYAATRATTSFQEYLTIAAQLATIGAPTLVVRGDKDDSVHPLSHALQWHAEAPNSDLWIAPGTEGASIISERLADFEVHLAAFLDGNRFGDNTKPTALPDARNE